MATKSVYDARAERFLNRFGLRFSVKKLEAVDHFPGEEDKGFNGLRWKYQASLKRSEGNRFTFIFYDSINNYDKGLEPSAYDVLSCLSFDSHCDEDFEDFCDNCGYNSDSIKAKATWRKCLKFSKRVNAFFTIEELEELREID